MKVTKKVWETRMQNLIKRRLTGTDDSKHLETIVSNYGRHLRAVKLGDKILDVGCGDMGISVLPEMEGKDYTGIDAFPVNEKVIKTTIEECKFVDQAFDTVICFAVLDGCIDLEKATQQMKRVAKSNVVFLTGIGIDPDKYHTHRIEEKMLDDLMLPFKPVMKNYLEPKVLLVEYQR